jgi:hypothetical protein
MKRRDFLVACTAGATTVSGLNDMSWSMRGGIAVGQDEINAKPAAKGDTTDPLAGPSQGPWRRLFLDGAVIERQSGLRREFHAARKHDAKPIIVADKPWEGKSAITGPYVYGTVLREGDKFRLWYQLLNQGNHVGYAESDDGIRWDKPNLGIVPFEGSAGTNLVVSAFSPELFAGVHCHNPSVIPRYSDPDPNRRYALYGFDGKSRGPRVAFSKDGLRWDYQAGADPTDSSKPLFESSDVVGFFADPYQGRYACTWKSRDRRGRAVGVATSPDGIRWSKVVDGPVFVADDHDPDATQIYGMPVFAYQGLYVGLPWIYSARYFRYGEYSVDKLHEAQADSPRTMDVQLAWSWDLVNWTRPQQRLPLIPRGAPGDWDGGMIVTARAPVVVGDELWFYYGGTDKVHDEPRAGASIGLAKLRVDGFCSMSSRAAAASGETAGEGWLITRREPFRTPRVMINARTGPLGEVTAEILDRRGRVIPGFSRSECVAFQGDATSHELTWGTERFPDRPRHDDFKIRFWLKDAELFSYLPADLDPAQPDLARFPAAGP